MKAGRPQAKDISDAAFLGEMARVGRTAASVMRWDMNLPFPEKVVLAKAGSLIRRGIISGCACGCRGDFVLKEK